MGRSTLGRDYDIGRTLKDYRRRISFLERRLASLFGRSTPESVATQECRLTRTSDYSLPHATTEIIPFDDEVFDYNGMHDNAVHPSLITFKEPGYYIVGDDLEIQSGTDSVRILATPHQHAGS